jgi:membrane associated rhomboid family serine protease
VLISSGVLFLLQLILETFGGFSLTPLLGFVPVRMLSGWFWQLFTYSFLHASMFHLLFNLLVIWTVGSELESLWGSRTFTAFYVVCALGAALTHGGFALLGIGGGPETPVIGSSGVVYGLLLAYGILFGERTMYFFMLFPMQARFFVLLLGAVELVSSVFSGRDGVSHLAHLGGMVAGFGCLAAMALWKKRQRLAAATDHVSKERKKRLKKAGHLRLVPGSEEEDEPKHWN